MGIFCTRIAGIQSIERFDHFLASWTSIIVLNRNAEGVSESEAGSSTVEINLRRLTRRWQMLHGSLGLGRSNAIPAMNYILAKP